MDRDVYDRLALLEDEHWWFAGRRRIVSEILSRLVGLKRGSAILEAGAGTGGNLAMLSGFGDVDAFEYDEAARQIARRKSGREVEFGMLPGQVPFADRRYDVIVLLDVLEHIEDDGATLAALAERLGDGGRIVVTVPAFQSLWSHHDETHHHFRRYTRSTLSEVAAKAGLHVERSFYFNSFLMPLAVGVRKLKALLGKDSPDDAIPGRIANAVLQRILATERYLIGRFPMPAGLSCGAVLSLNRAPG